MPLLVRGVSSRGKEMKKLATALLMAPMLSWAAPIDSISAILYGDPRPDNPTGIELGISGVQDGANENIFNFTVDFTAAHEALHGVDTSKLLEFYFNVSPADAGQWTVSNQTAGYTVYSPATVQGGGNNSGFLFELDQTPPNGTGVPLTFTLTYAGGEIMSENFTNAPDWEGDPALLEAQIGAHIGNLVTNDITCPLGGCSDSGFATADWPTGGADPQSVDAPAHAALLALGLVGLVASRRMSK